MNLIKRIFAITLCCLVLCSAQLFALIKSPPEKAILPNGMRVIVVEDKSLPLAAVSLVFNAQATSHDNCNSGLSRIYRSLLENSGFDGQSRYDFNAELEKVGIISDFGSSQEAFFTACQGNADQVEKMLTAINKLGFMLKPDSSDFTQAKDATLRFLKTGRKYPLSSGRMTRAAWQDLFPGHSSECHGPIDEEQLNRVEISQLNKFGKKVFVPNNAVLVVVGDVVASDIFKLSMKVFGELKASLAEPTTVIETLQTGSRKKENIEFAEVDETQVIIGFEAPSYVSPDMPVTQLWKTALDGINSAWLEAVVAKDFPELKGLHANYIPGRETGIFVIGFSSREADVNRPVNFILSSLANMFNDPPKGEDLRRVIEMQQLKDLQNRETRLERAYDLGIAELMGSYRIADGLVAAYSRVTPEDMKRVARKMFSSSSYAIRIAYPLKMQKAEDRPVQMKVLDNGTRLMAHNFSGSEVVGLSLLFGIDSCATDDKEKKLARVVAEMVAAFINDRENRRFNRQLDNIGASLSAAFTGEALVLSAKTQKQNLAELAGLLRDLIKFPEYSERFFKKSKEKLLERIEDDKQSVNYIFNRRIMQTLFPGLDIMGSPLTKEEIEKISFKDVQAFYRNWAVGANLHVTAVGNFSPDKVTEVLAEAFRDIPPGKAINRSQCPAWVAKPLEKTSVEKIQVPAGNENAFVSVAFRMKPFLLIDNKEELRTNFGANLVISHVLFSSSNAILAQELKKIDAFRGLIGNYHTSQTHAIFFFFAEVPKDKVEQVKTLVEKIVAGIPQLNISRDNITAAGMNLRALFNRMLEKSDVQAAILSNFLANGLKEDFLEEILGIYSSVTIEDVKKAAAENFNNYFMLIGEPEK